MSRISKFPSLASDFGGAGLPEDHTSSQLSTIFLMPADTTASGLTRPSGAGDKSRELEFLVLASFLRLLMALPVSSGLELRLFRRFIMCRKCSSSVSSSVSDIEMVGRSDDNSFSSLLVVSGELVVEGGSSPPPVTPVVTAVEGEEAGEEEGEEGGWGVTKELRLRALRREMPMVVLCGFGGR